MKSERTDEDAMDGLMKEFTPARKLRAEEEDRLRDLELAIEHRVQQAPPEPGEGIALPHSQVALSPSELRAFQKPFEAEVSFRAEYAACTRRLVVLSARMVAESESYRQRADTTYLWQQYVPSLAYLHEQAEQALLHAMPVIELAKARGLTQRVEELADTQAKISPILQAVTEILAACRLRSGGAVACPNDAQAPLCEA